tara:strand:+ start:258 stop:497 length:240 start_codon:yes stop_codon:yes gene_type:complete
MDFLKKGADMLNKNKEGGSAQQQNTGTTGGAAAPAQGQAGGSAAGGQDYGDKGMFFLHSLLTSHLSSCSPLSSRSTWSL